MEVGTIILLEIYAAHESLRGPSRTFSPLARRNLHGQIRATLIVISPSRNITGNLVTTYLIQLPAYFRQCVTLKVKLTSRIRRVGFCLLMLS
jgi:hypothetical protein